MEINLYFLVSILHFQPLFLHKFDCFDRKRTQHHRDGKQDLRFFSCKKKIKKEQRSVFFIAQFTQPILLQVTLNSEELLSRKTNTQGETRQREGKVLEGGGGGSRSLRRKK